MTVRALNLKRFGKLVSFARSIPHDDTEHSAKEREGAWGRAEHMARASGMSLSEALSKLDTANGSVPTQKPQAPQEDPFSRWFREMDEQRREAASRPWPEHPLEQALREALAGHDVVGMGLHSEHLPPETVKAIRDAIAWPENMQEAIAEEAVWNVLEKEREAEAPQYRLSDGPLIRRFMLRDYLLSEASTPEDMVARANWAANRRQHEMPSERETSDDLRRVADDMHRLFEMLKEARSEASQPYTASHSENGERITNRQKRERLRAILSEPGADAMSLREVARKAGVSVQGVANFKRAVAEGRVNL